MISIEIEVAKALAYYSFHPSLPDQMIIEATLEGLQEGLLFLSDQDIEIVDQIVRQNPIEALLSDISIIRTRAQVFYQTKK